MEKGYIWQGEYGKRSHLKPLFKELLKEQDTSSLEMMAIFVNNNPYNFEFYIAMIYDIPRENHVEKMMELFENAGLISRNDLTFSMLMKSMGDRRFNSCTFLSEKELIYSLNLCLFFRKLKYWKSADIICDRLERKNRFLSVIHQWIKRMWK